VETDVVYLEVQASTLTRKLELCQLPANVTEPAIIRRWPQASMMHFNGITSAERYTNPFLFLLT